MFLAKGYRVVAVDGSSEIAACAEQLLGQPVKVTTFQELEFSNEFDGVWACASLLHCPKSQIVDVLGRVTNALKINGVAYNAAA